MMNVHKSALRAAKLIHPYVRQTPVKVSTWLSKVTGAHVSVKCENLQYTGSFKFRGAMNKLLSLSNEERSAGIVAASTGNHGAAVARSMSLLETPGIIFVPEDASIVKLEVIESYGAKIRKTGNDCIIAELAAKKMAKEEGMTYVSPYNDLDIIAGQATVGIELLDQYPEMDAVFVSLGGGGLISGVAGVLKGAGREVTVVACSPENSPVMHKSVEAGRILDFQSKPTLSDGTAGGVEEGAITFDLCRELLDDYVLVSESEIASTLGLFIDNDSMRIEGSAAVSIAAFLKQSKKWADKRVMIVLCGGNISSQTLKAVQ